MSEPKIICASTEESPNDICERLGVETIRNEGSRPLWRYEGKIYPRPEHVQNFEDKMLEYFNIKIVYQDKNQLSIF